jgi:hypothetical protein
MKRSLFCFLPLLLSTPGWADTVFDGYKAYYSTLPDRLFKGTALELEAYSLLGDAIPPRYLWQGKVAGRAHNVQIHEGMLEVDGRVIEPATIKVFPGEFTLERDSDSIAGMGAMAFFSAQWACVEYIAPSASGTAVRHRDVFLVDLEKREAPQPQAWKLPSLFASCAGIRLRDGQIRFDKVEYRYRAEGEEAAGVSFTEYVLREGVFVQTGRPDRAATFVEPGNVYRFTLDKRQ